MHDMTPIGKRKVEQKKNIQKKGEDKLISGE